MPSFESVAHEISHGVIYYSITTPQQHGLVLKGESGALAESICDIFAALAEFHVTPASADWIIGEDDIPDYQRVLYDPLQSASPYTYLGVNWESNATQQNGGCHKNSAVPSLWFYLFCEGRPAGSPTEPAIVGVGRPLAGRVLYRMVTTKLKPSATFADARSAAEQVTQELCGQFSQPQWSTLMAWNAVGVDALPVHPYTDPSPGQTDVAPWMAKLSWEVGEGETGWSVDISTLPDLSGAINIPTSKTEVIPGDITGATVEFDITVATVEVTLDAGKKYYWRVRAEETPALEKAPRPVDEFTTDNQKPHILRPRDCGRDTLVHPWQLEFAWGHVEGANRYWMEVARDKHFENLLFPRKELDETQVVLDVPVDTNLWWRVCAVRDWNNFGEFSNPGEWAVQPFTTDLPQAEIVSPIATKVYPWKTKLKWKSVQGAAGYRVELTYSSPYPAADLGVPSDKVAIDIPITDGETTETEVNLPSNWDHVSYNWEVWVLGPEPWDEEGAPSKTGYMITDGKATMVDLLSPPVTDPPQCLPFGEPVTLTWSSVPHAEGYRVLVSEMFGKLGEQCQKGALVYDNVHDAVPDSDVQTAKLYTISGPTSGNDVIGYTWEVQAIGPEGLPGVQFHDWYYYVKPTIPQPLILEQTFTQGDEIIVSWESQMAHGGGFVVNLYDGSGCDGSPVASEVIQGSSMGTTSVELSHLSLNTWYSWKVRPFAYDGCSQTKLWSQCAKVKVKKKVTAPTPTSECGELVAWGTTQMQTHHIDMNKTQGNFTFWYDAINIPDRFVVSYEGSALWNQCVSGSDTVALSFGPGTSSVITVAVLPNCYAQYQGATEWAFKVSCQ
jgi:Thermolysin metallopeptidase, alpha-helical domain